MRLCKGRYCVFHFFLFGLWFYIFHWLWHCTLDLNAIKICLERKMNGKTINMCCAFYYLFLRLWYILVSIFWIRVITKLPNSEQSYKGKVKTHKYINRQNQSTTGKLWKGNDPDLVQAFLKKWWVESDFKAPNLPLSLRLKVSGCHYNSI